MSQKTTEDQTKNTIHEIVECAVKWISADADNPDTPSSDWQRAIPLMKAAPEMLDIIVEGAKVAQEVVVNWESGDLAAAVRNLEKWLDATRKAVKAPASA